LTQASELIGAEGARFAGYLPDDLQLVTVYSAAVSATSKAPESAEAFMRFVTGPVGSELLRKYGWDVARSSQQRAG
jgi:molybdate transport system substrate-binding protein